jgi:hypothetical protein
VLIPFGVQALDPGEIFFSEKHFQEAAGWYEGELKHLPVSWLQDKIFYNLGTSLEAADKDGEVRRAFYAISKEAYTYPLFRLRLMYNWILSLRNAAEKQEEGGRRAWLLQEALFLLQMMDLTQCSDQCPEYHLKDLKRAIQMDLGNIKEGSMAKEDSPLVLDTLIDLFLVKALWPDLRNESVLALGILMENAAMHFDKFPAYLSAKEAFEKAQNSPQEVREQLLMAALALTQLKKGIAIEPKAWLRGVLDELILSDHLRELSSLKESRALENARTFFSFVFEWQKPVFVGGRCVCVPWNLVIPLYSSGLAALRAPESPVQLPYVYGKWQEALRFLEAPPSKGGGGGGRQEDSAGKLRELQEMQMLDRQDKPRDKGNKGNNPESMGW